MAVGTNARAHKRHSSFLDEKVYDDMSVIKEYFGLSKNQQINKSTRHWRRTISQECLAKLLR